MIQMNAIHDDLVLGGYDPGPDFCELSRSTVAVSIRQRLGALSTDALRQRAASAEAELYNLGITFTVYSEKDSIDRILPFDVIPRVLSAAEWRIIESGVVQRVTALNLLLADLYGAQTVIRDGVLPADLVLNHAQYQPVMQGLKLPHDTYVHVCGTDIIRDENGIFMVLEDNARTPSGVSYVVENRHMMLRAFPDLMDGQPVRSVDDYGPRLLAALRETAPSDVLDPRVVLLSPGTYNSAFFEHVFLAREMGIPLVEGRDFPPPSPLAIADAPFARAADGPDPPADWASPRTFGATFAPRISPASRLQHWSC